MDLEAVVELQRDLCSEHRTETAVVEKIAACGFQILGMGKARVAVEDSFGTSVLKLAWREAGIADNALEARVYDSAPAELKQVLAPVIETFPEHVSRQARCSPLQFSDRAVPVIEILGRHGIIDGIQNLGFLDGKVVCYDYATVGMGKFLDLLEEIKHS